MTAEEICAIPCDEEGWRTIPGGIRVQIGASLEAFVVHLVGLKATAGDDLVCVKAVTEQRKPYFARAHSTVTYQKGLVVEAEGEFFDGEFADGILVALADDMLDRIDYGCPTPDCVWVFVRVKKNDILHSGQHGAIRTFRVRALEVLT